MSYGQSHLNTNNSILDDDFDGSVFVREAISTEVDQSVEAVVQIGMQLLPKCSVVWKVEDSSRVVANNVTSY